MILLVVLTHQQCSWYVCSLSLSGSACGSELGQVEGKCVCVCVWDEVEYLRGAPTCVNVLQPVKGTRCLSLVSASDNPNKVGTSLQSGQPQVWHSCQQ